METQQVNDRVEIELLKRENTDLKAKLDQHQAINHRIDKLWSLYYKIIEAKETLYTIESVLETHKPK